ncbi:hypothetical protein PQR65_05245 [Paraburkholderia nemoris]|uniref:hypothetical protein n=1 Tax=Paraburkholderia nemoris TaxID=2793076 RepID=UPI0038B8195A
MIHEPSDNEILAGWDDFRDWRRSRNGLLLFDALARVSEAERRWNASARRRAAMRREWQVLRRCVTTGLARLRAPLLAARTHSQTARAIYSGGKRATLARIDQLNDRAVKVALVGSTIEQAGATLKGWGIPRTKGTLKKRASQLGLTRRKTKPLAAPRAVPKRPTQPAQSPKTVEVTPGRRRHRGSRY